MGKLNNRIPFGLKLCLFVAPLIIIPMCVVAIWVYTVSADMMTTVSRNKLLVEAESSAGKIDAIFRTCEKDLQTLWLFFFEQAFNVTDPENYGVNMQKLVPALDNFRNSSPMYLQVGFWNVSGNRVVSSFDGFVMRDYLHPAERRLILDMETDQTYVMAAKSSVSPVFYSERLQGYIVTVYRAFYDSFGTLTGALMIDLDFNQLVALVDSSGVSVNEEHTSGFAFLVDHNGETIFHPRYEPYSTRFTQYRDPVMREFIIDTILGRSGFKIYQPVDDTGENMAAYAPIVAAGWTLVKTVPLIEFTESATRLRNDIIRIGVAMVIAAILVLWFLAQVLLKPLSDLTKATKEVAAGNLDVELKTTGGSYETAELTRDFIIMARNLRKIQAELVASEKMVSLGRLSAGVAHELRNPLNAIKLTILYMQRHRNDEEVFAESLGIIFKEIERLDKFVTDFLYFARETPPAKDYVDVTAILRSIIKLNQAEADRHHIRVNLIAEDNLSEASLDEHQITQVFLNLYYNALQAMPQGGELTIEIKGEINNDYRRGLKIIFTDTGTGIEDAIMSSIFDPFFTTKRDGNGLGLAISFSIIEGHGGTLKLGNREDGISGAVAEVFVLLN